MDTEPAHPGRSGGARRDLVFYGLALAAVIAVLAIPALLYDRIHPSDGSQFALNGALFVALFSDFGAFLDDPVGWLWAYYEQYPALNVRRYPPLFGLAAAAVYGFTGIGILGAKITVLVFTAAFAFIVFLLNRRMLGDDLLAFCATAAMLAVPTMQDYFNDVWLDLPCLALTLAAFLLYLRLDPREPPRVRQILPLVACAVGALYVYQLAGYLLAGLAVFVLLERRTALLRQPAFVVGLAVGVVALVPLVVQAIVLAPASVYVALGAQPDGLERYASHVDKTSLAYWTEYLVSLWQRFPFQLAGALLWAATRVRVPVARAEKLMLVAFVVAYLLFSLLSSRSPRYTLHISIPLSFLAAVGIVDGMRLIAQRAPVLPARAVTTGALVALLALQGLTVARNTDYFWISGMDAPAASALDSATEQRILYSGPYSAAYVLALRGLDHGRRAHVLRGTVQLQPGEDVGRFLEDHRIGVVVLELNDARIGLTEFDAVRDSLLAFMRRSDAFRRTSAYGLPHGRSEHENVIELLMYERQP